MGIEAAALSNSVEVLFEHLKANLFSEAVVTDSGVFSERILITPSNGMQQWIQTRLAASLDVAAGITTAFLDKGVSMVRQRVFEPNQGKPLPTRLELILEIEAAISEAVLTQEAVWAPLVKYVNGKERRKTALALYLAQLFERYGVCAGEASLDWEQKPSNWQEALWAKVFSRWDYPQRALQGLKSKEMIPSGLSIHLFAFSHISPLYFHFFRQAGRNVPVYLYHLSPCQEFWSDLPFDHPSLLGPMGKMGRAMARLIEESDTLAEESYILFGGNEQLKQIQRDLLTLQPTQTCVEDSSIQVHSASTRRQEIANLHTLLVELADQGGIEPRDVVVMAPNITLYAPYIQAIFGRCLDYQIADMPSQKGIPAVEGLFLLLGLEKKRWCAPAVLELFDHPLFRKKWNFSEEDLACIRLWVRQTGIRWGMDGAHRALLLEKVSGENMEVEETATWMDGLGHLIEELAIPYEPPRIEFTQAETLGKTVELIASLYKDTRELDEKKTLSQWTQFFKRLAQTYFMCTDESEPLFALFEKIEKSGRLFPSTLYSYPFVHTLLQECAGAESVTVNRNQLQAVRFCSMLPMRAIPAKVICLLGMNHDAFPRKEQLQALDLLGKHPKCGYSPSRVDFDRSLFLEAILSAREKLIISYLGLDPLDLSESPPSSAVAQLLPMISKNQVFKHPVQKLEEAAIRTPPPFKIRVEETTALPQGACEITTSDLSRLSRSFLGHYLYSRGLRISQEEIIQEEETFLLTPARRALLRQKALQEPLKSVLSRVQREGDFPLGPFGKLARLQLNEEMASLPKHPLTRMVLEPFPLILDPSLTVNFTGAIEGVFDQGLCVQGKKDFRTAVKAWPLYLLLNAYDSSKTQLLFAASDEVGSRFFEDPCVHLREWTELFFYAQAHPVLLSVEWIEPILKQDPKKLAQMEHYDHILHWYLRGKGKIDAAGWIEAYYPIVDKVYGAMAHAWF